MTAGCPSLIDFYDKLREAWSAATGGKWRRDNPAAGQCSVTALVVQDELGGEILKTDVDGAWHFYNRIDGRRVDFTMSQFDSPIGYDDLPSNRQERSPTRPSGNMNCCSHGFDQAGRRQPAAANNVDAR